MVEVRVADLLPELVPLVVKPQLGSPYGRGEFALYGTVAKMKLKPGAEGKLMESMEGVTPPGQVATFVFKSDADPNVHFVTTVFESKDAYKKFADSPEQDKRFRQMRELLATEPEWHDGEVVHHQVKVGATH
jgi:heme-degrading monooxygenase HmoA